MKYSQFDPVDYLKSDADIASYLTSALNENDPDLLLCALQDIARAKGMSKLAQATGLNRESLYKALRAGSKPRFATVYKILAGLGIKLQAVPA